MAVRLSNENLDQLPQAVKRPHYDRSKLSAGILHIGVGNFHRAHQAWYLHRLMQEGLAHDWAIIGAGVRPYDEAQRTKLARQDYLTTLIELDPKGRSAEVIGSMIDYVPVAQDCGSLIQRMSEPDIRVVSLTVTEGGYYIDPVTKQFDETHPDIVHDANNPKSPRTAFGAMVAALKHRRNVGTGPFTGQSCDNLQGNGEILRQTVVSLARLSDPELADWIDENCTFPNSMVDCIVPATGDGELELVKELGIDDKAPVTHENFRQWVIEDDFCAGRPAWEKAGATITADVHPYEAMKIRILNGGHQIIANPGEILGIKTISACMEHELIGPLFRKIAHREIAPHVHAVPGMTAKAYIELVSTRFSNPEIVDTVRRVSFDGSSRHTGFMLPVLRDALASGSPISGLALSQALWSRMCAGTREDGSMIEPNDPFWGDLQPAAIAARSRPEAWLEQTAFYGRLDEDHQFSQAFARWLTLIWQQGTAAALQKYLDE